MKATKHLAPDYPGRVYPHTVPLGYFRDGDDIYLPARGQRRVNVQRNPKVSLLVEAGGQIAELRGPCSTVIVGATNPEQARENAECADVELSAEDLAEIDQLTSR